ncbi:MAG: PDZ domain-containing protein [Sedimentisphaerales bacterium]|nr:PDZ domain-containing protein [Sedimentisphaerales bacterium]
MKIRNSLMIVLAVLVCCAGAVCGESEPGEGKGYIGIRMDARPLPELLIKHLRLAEDQGVRIQNVGVGTPADKAGLERDDIIIGLNGKDVTDNKEFAETVQKAGVGEEISLEIIHLGERKTVKLELASFAADSDFKAKFPPEPEIVQSWQPGRMFRLMDDSQGWIQVGPDGSVRGGGGGFGIGDGGFIGSENDTLESHINKVFKELYTYHYSTDGDDYTITIEGDPDDEDTYIIVDAGDSHFKRPLKDIDKLPKKYQQAAEQAVKGARRAAKTRQRGWKPTLPQWPDLRGWQFNQGPGQPGLPQLAPDNDMLKRIEKQMQDIQKRIEQLEKERSRNPALEDQKGEEKELHEQESGDSQAPGEEKI